MGVRAYINSHSPGLYELSKIDLALGTFLAVEYTTFALWCPSLVQHADVTSIRSESVEHPDRISKSYEQAYG